MSRAWWLFGASAFCCAAAARQRAAQPHSRARAMPLEHGLPRSHLLSETRDGAAAPARDPRSAAEIAHRVRVAARS